MTIREKYQRKLRERLSNEGEQFTFQLFEVGTFRAVVLKGSPASETLSKKYQPIREVTRPALAWLGTWGECGELGELAAGAAASAIILSSLTFLQAPSVPPAGGSAPSTPPVRSSNATARWNRPDSELEEKQMKLCINCVHYVSYHYFGGSQCERVPSRTSRVTGDVFYPQCADERSAGAACGEGASHFKPAPPRSMWQRWNDDCTGVRYGTPSCTPVRK